MSRNNYNDYFLNSENFDSILQSIPELISNPNYIGKNDNITALITDIDKLIAYKTRNKTRTISQKEINGLNDAFTTFIQNGSENPQTEAPNNVIKELKERINDSKIDPEQLNPIDSLTTKLIELIGLFPQENQHVNITENISPDPRQAVAEDIPGLSELEFKTLFGTIKRLTTNNNDSPTQSALFIEAIDKLIKHKEQCKTKILNDAEIIILNNANNKLINLIAEATIENSEVDLEELNNQLIELLIEVSPQQLHDDINQDPIQTKEENELLTERKIEELLREDQLSIAREKQQRIEESKLTEQEIERLAREEELIIAREEEQRIEEAKLTKQEIERLAREEELIIAREEEQRREEEGVESIGEEEEVNPLLPRVEAGYADLPPEAEAEVVEDTPSNFCIPYCFNIGEFFSRLFGRDDNNNDREGR